MSIKFLFSLHNAPPILYLWIKNPCDFGCLNKLVLRTDFNPDYLIFSRFYLKNRTTIKPTQKSLFFNDFNARRGIATPNRNSMVNDGNYPVRFYKKNRSIGQHLHTRCNERASNVQHLLLSYLLLYRKSNLLSSKYEQMFLFLFSSKRAFLLDCKGKKMLK